MLLQVLPPSLLLHRKSKNCFILAKRESLRAFPFYFFDKSGLRLSFSLVIMPKIRYHRSKYVPLRHKGVDFLMAEKEVKGIKKFFEEFKAFAMRGNVLDMAVGVVIGGAFGKITNSVVNDIIMPLISMLTGGIDFSAWKWVLKEAVMEGAKVVTPEIAVNYGNLIAVILDFIIIAFAVFCMVKAINKMHDKLSKPAEPESEKAPEPTKEELLLAEIRDLLKEQSK